MLLYYFHYPKLRAMIQKICKKILFFSLVAALPFVACKKESTEAENTTENTNTNTTDTTSNNNGGTNPDTTNNNGGTNSGSNKPSATTVRFEANGKDCGITDGYANQQHIVSHLVHLNLDKCNGDTYRPTLTLNFEFGKTIAAGTYTVGLNSTPTGNQVYINSYKYNWTDWVATSGTVVVTQNSKDSSKIDIELKSISMRNENAADTKNPANDILTGFIIEI